MDSSPHKEKGILGYLGNPRKPPVYQKPSLKEVSKLYNKLKHLHLMLMNCSTTLGSLWITVIPLK